jgi:glyoxylate/hydroxypyruvate reductase
MSVLAVITPTWNAAHWTERLRDADPGMEVRAWPALGDPREITHVACWLPPPRLLASFPNLKVIFSLGAGVDAILRDDTVPQHVPLVRVADQDLTDRMSEYVMLHVLLHHRDQLRLFKAQAERRWDSFSAFAAKDFCVGIMGLGVLGRDAAQKLAMMGYRLRGWSRTEKHLQSVECFAGAEGLGTFLSGTDILVCLLPGTAQTDGILNRRLFQQLSRRGPFGAPVLINAGRGQLQNEEDIAACLDDGTLHGASLDVFRQEPLPEASPLWRSPKLVITPHAAADSAPIAICAYVAKQIVAHEKGEALQNVVERARGY